MSGERNDQLSPARAAQGIAPPVTLDEALAQALEKALACHAAGYWCEAEQLYRAIVQARPDHPQANHQIGLIEVQRQQPAAGLAHFLAALEAAPDVSQYWLSYIDTLLLAGQTDTARQVLALGQQQGLTGDAVEALVLRLAVDEPGRPSQEASEPKPSGRGHKPSRKAAADHMGKPSAEEEDALLALFAAGRYSEGEPLAGALTKRFPQHGFGWKVLGVMLKSLGRNAEALPAMQKAARLLPRDEQVQSNLGLVLADMGQLLEAEACHRRALKIRRDFAEAHYNLGNALHIQKRHKEAEASYRRAVALKPAFALAHCNLGNTLMDQGRLAEAEAAYQRTLALDPGVAEAHCNLGRTLRVQGRLDEAENSYRRALALNPAYATAHSNLGDTLRALDRLSEAESALRRAIECKPELAEAYYNLGNVLSDQDRDTEAEAAWRGALSCKPDFPEVLVVLAVALKEQGRISEAEESLRRAVEYRPGFAEAQYNLGNIFRDHGRLDDAEARFRCALDLSPDLAVAWVNLGVTLTEMGRYSEAEVVCRRAMALKPDDAVAHSNLFFCLTHNEKIDAAALFAEHCRFGEHFEAPLRTAWTPHSNRQDPERCLQIGFVSADLRNHAVANFIEPVLAGLAKYPLLSVHAYSTHKDEDHVTHRLREHVAHWHPVSGVTDSALAERIREDGIDILIDLSGHTAHHRLLTFARKPAPIQASWMGYPGTTGLQAMDYFLTDRFLLPVGEFDWQFTEKIVCLPASVPFLPFSAAPPVSPLPALSQGHITFASFNRPTKISASTIALWSQLLAAVPNSRMLLGAMRPDRRADELIEDFARNGVARDRLSFQARCDMNAYLERHRQVDICLDTFPYTGGTTTLHALWMGVPTLTLAGDTAPGRQGASILGNVGLDRFITRNAMEFVARGIEVTADLVALASLRADLRERLRQSAMGQPDLIAASLARAMRIMWRRWCDGLPAEAFEVQARDVALDRQGPCRGTAV